MSQNTKTNIEQLAAWWRESVPTPAHLPILQKLCERFGINPDPNAIPRELLAVAGYGNAEFWDPLHVVAVTAGGQKLLMYADGSFDAATEDRLRRLLNAYVRRVVGRVTEWIPAPLPDDLTLPPAARHGITDGRMAAGRPGGR